MSEPFKFRTQSHLPFVLGRKAKNPVELLDGIKQVPASSIYYHTHHFLLEHQYLAPEPSNDFAYWLGNILGLSRMAESLASIDIVSFRTLEYLRAEFIRILSDIISRVSQGTACQEGEEFYFITCTTVALPTSYQATDLAEFLDAVGAVSLHSIYYHFCEAPLRLATAKNDFSIWLEGIGERELADRLTTLDPYTMTLDELRQKIIRMGRRRLGQR